MLPILSSCLLLLHRLLECLGITHHVVVRWTRSEDHLGAQPSCPVGWTGWPLWPSQGRSCAIDSHTGHMQLGLWRAGSTRNNLLVIGMVTGKIGLRFFILLFFFFLFKRGSQYVALIVLELSM